MRTIAAKEKNALDERDLPAAGSVSDERRTINIVLAAAPRSVAAARQAVARLLNGVDTVPEVVAEDVLLLVSELVTNAVLHARTSTRVSAAVQAGLISVAVADDDRHHAPFLAQRGSLATNGRGVMLVDALATDWGIDLFESSKVVWFESSYDETGVKHPPVRLGPDGQAVGGRPRIRRRARSA